MDKENNIQIVVVGDKNVGKNSIFITFMYETVQKSKIDEELNKLNLDIKNILKIEILLFLRFANSVFSFLYKKEIKSIHLDTLPENIKIKNLRKDLELVKDCLDLNHSLIDTLSCFPTLYKILNSNYFTRFEILKRENKFINISLCSELNEIKNIKNVNIFIICYSNNLFDNVDKWSNKIKKKYPNTQFLLVETKIDLRGDVPNFNGVNKAKEINAFKFMECTSFNKISVVDVFNTAINIVLLNKKSSPKNKTLRFAKMHENAKIPEKSEPGSIGLDLFSCENKTIKKGETVTVKTGIAIENNYPNTYARIAPRSGLALKHGIDVFAGVIDRSYRGEIKVILFNTGNVYDVKIGDRIAQIIIEKSQENLQIEEVDYNNFSKTERGSLGFGSSGY